MVVDASRPDVPIVYANRAYQEASGYVARELIGSSWLDYAAGGTALPDGAGFDELLAGPGASEIGLSLLRKDGGVWPGRFRLAPIRAGNDGRRLVLVEHLDDAVRSGGGASELRPADRGTGRFKPPVVERTDSLTGLLCRSEFAFMLRRDLALARRNQQSLHLLLFTIPELETYRRTFGAKAADSCLRMIGAQITGTFRRASDLSGRIDETTLAVAIGGQEDNQAEPLIAEVERKARNLGLHNPRGRSSRYVYVVGAMARADTDSDDVDSLLARCSLALAARCDNVLVPVSVA